MEWTVRARRPGGGCLWREHGRPVERDRLGDRRARRWVARRRQQRGGHSGQLEGSLRACQSGGDCVIKQEQTDCCGTILYVGVSSASAARFDACEAAWVLHFPGCGCDSNKMTTEDGKMTSPAVDGGGPAVHCTDFTMSGGVCMTYTP